MAKQDDINRLDAVAAIIKLHDRIKELEVELDQLNIRYDSLEEDFISYKETFN